MNISSISYAYPALDGDARADIARRLVGKHLPEETVVLSTCLRVEVMTAGEPAQLATIVDGLLGGGSVGPGVVREGAEAVIHLSRVAAGLESPVLGEQEILAQFRQALREAKDDGQVDGLFARLLDNVVSIGRRARDHLPGSAHASMASVAAQVVGAFPRIAVLGAGMMSRAVAHSLLGLPAPPEVTVVARRPDLVSIEGAEVWPFDKAVDAIADFPAVVSATSAKRRPVDDDDLARILASRTEPLTLIDMAMPPDFSPPPDAPVRYVDIDDLARMADRNAHSEMADALVAEEAATAFRRYSEHHDVGPVIARLIEEADRLVDEMTQRFGTRLSSEEDLAILRQAAHTLARTLVARPVEYVKRTDRPGALEAVAEAFGLDDA